LPFALPLVQVGDRTDALAGLDAAPGKPDRELVRAAIALLARRDYGRKELGQRLLRRIEAADSKAQKGREGGVDRAVQLDRRGRAAAAVEEVLDALQAKGLLSEARFANEFIRSRAARFGPVRLRHELLRRGVQEELIESALRGQLQGEYARALSLWQQRFGVVAKAAPERARQARFLLARGFSHEIVRRVVSGCDED
jgi:regulatory protein